MCGFGGVINHRQELQEQQIAEIAGHVNFRGPDSCGVRILDGQLSRSESGSNALFFNRLAIIDLDSRSNQPFEDADHLLLFNGEIYNYTELKELLQKEGVQFHTTSDTEVLFYGLKKWGRKILGKLNGMFAFFWLDKRSGTYFASRDRLGIKPLYYHFHKGTFYFSSELHSIVHMLEELPPLSQRAIEMYLWMQYIPTPYSIFENISKLPPGNLITGNVHDATREPVVESYWDVYNFVNHGNGASRPGDLEEVLRDSVSRQLQADVPIGLFLSSGIDSSLLAAIVNKYFSSGEKINFFTVSFGEETSEDESTDARNFIDGFKNPNMINHHLQIDPKYLQGRLGEMYRYFDEPFGDYASLLNWGISEKARDFVTVALSGDGADELFWGYGRYNKWQEISRFNQFPIVSKSVTTAASLLPNTNLRNKLQKTFSHDPVQRHFELFLMPAFRPLLKRNLPAQPMWATQNAESIAGREDLPGILDIKTYLADAMLYKVDRASMATSLEVRVPYLDNKVLEYALNLPLEYKSNAKYQNKAILKELIKKLAPHYNVDRPKKGFSFPLGKWLKHEWRELVLDSINRNSLSELGLDPKPYLDIVDDFYRDRNAAHVEVWYLLNLVLWKKSIAEIGRLQHV